MSTEEDLTIEAEAKMNAAQVELEAYIQSKQRDPARLAFLIRKVDEAIAKYEKVRTAQQ